MLRSVVILAIVFAGLLFFGDAARVACPAIANGSVNAGWNAYRLPDLRAAEHHFKSAYSRCPDHVGALIGLGYVAFRQNRDADAERWFERALEQRPDVVDAIAGKALLAWRHGDLERVHTLFSRVVAIDPHHHEALGYLDVLPEGFGPPPDRPALELPDTLEYLARTNGSHFEVRSAGGWRPFYIKGVNLGAALPGSHPSQFPDSATYAGWIADIAEMGANTIRLYTIHPPGFYKALHDHNSARPDAPLWVIHGVWAEEPPEHDYDDAEWLDAFKAEIRDVVDVVHGRADIRPRRGHASGHYVADVAEWTLGYILGREWEPYSVIAYNESNPGVAEWGGRYLEVRDGNAMDVWLARVSDYLVAYETETYRVQRPVAYTTWPTLDPLTHVTETTQEEDLAIRRHFGELAASTGAAFDDDAVSVDPSLVRTTAAFRAGYFAAYHIYPYYPDFLVLDPVFTQGRSPFGPSAYFGYMEALKRHHADIPVVVAEYGVPASLGNSHMQPQGWHHGGHTEEEMARINARLTREIAAADMAGGILFAWIDEWFKRHWLTQEFTVPLERNRVWHNRLSPEEHYGVIAMEPEPRLEGESLAERIEAWRAVPPLYEDEDGAALRAVADEAALHLLLEAGAGAALPDSVYLGFDLLDADAGSFRWPNMVGPRLPVGIDFGLVAAAGGVRLLAQPEANQFMRQPDTVGLALRGELSTPEVEVDGVPGFFAGRYRGASNVSARPVRRDDGRFDPLLVVTNSTRFGRDTTEYAAMGYDRGILRRGPAPDGSWERLPEAGVLEVRIPWMLLNVTDPSQRRVLRHGARAPNGDLGTVQVEGIRLVGGWREGDGGWRQWPASAAATDVALFTWREWETPRWRARRRPVFDAMAAAYRSLERHLATLDTMR